MEFIQGNLTESRSPSRRVSAEDKFLPATNAPKMPERLLLLGTNSFDVKEKELQSVDLEFCVDDETETAFVFADINLHESLLGFL